MLTDEQKTWIDQHSGREVYHYAQELLKQERITMETYLAMLEYKMGRA